MCCAIRYVVASADLELELELESYAEFGIRVRIVALDEEGKAEGGIRDYIRKLGARFGVPVPISKHDSTFLMFGTEIGRWNRIRMRMRIWYGTVCMGCRVGGVGFGVGVIFGRRVHIRQNENKGKTSKDGRRGGPRREGVVSLSLSLACLFWMRRGVGVIRDEGRNGGRNVDFDAERDAVPCSLLEEDRGVGCSVIESFGRSFACVGRVRKEKEKEKEGEGGRTGGDELDERALRVVLRATRTMEGFLEQKKRKQKQAGLE
ncbi:hypothetical protein B0H11DRAFT_2185956 [Mycena galericulata]|nr:hypothetical protein B0H11DRAFT_2185956 [Mycena galericulata]